MFKHRSSRYNFLDLSKIFIYFLLKIELKLSLDNNLTGDRRLAHLKDRMRQCQKVFFNLKGALTKIEKQRKIFLRRQKLLRKSIYFILYPQKTFCSFHSSSPNNNH